MERFLKGLIFDLFAYYNFGFFFFAIGGDFLCILYVYKYTYIIFTKCVAKQCNFLLILNLKLLFCN